YKLNPEQALVVSADFFAPLVDDPYAYGAIAAANALSDIYAMGGEAALALNIAAFPADMASDVITEIFRGGADKIEEAGAALAGGHTIIDAEPKYGLCVIGLVHPERVFTKAGARPGDLLYLTKPLGTGLITTAAKFDETDSDALSSAIESMTALNRHAAHLVRELEAHALTDVTGFGILGHGHEIAAASGVALQFDASRLPILPGALDCAYRGTTTGGAIRNEDYLRDKAWLSPELSPEMRHVLFDPQTSGGLLFAVDSEAPVSVEEAFGKADLPVWQVGIVTDGEGVRVLP
ncbi:MAG: selenide, water dikinase SelD, partial [Dehalococcoidia bacterium]|nr:selenide, water dikinase SelD [Dehalococcoidia bacterium]